MDFGAVTSTAVYTTISANVFTVPVHPGVSPEVPINASVRVREDILRKYNAAVYSFQEYNNVTSALKKTDLGGYKSDILTKPTGS